MDKKIDVLLIQMSPDSDFQISQHTYTIAMILNFIFSNSLRFFPTSSPPPLLKKLNSIFNLISSLLINFSVFENCPITCKFYPRGIFYVSSFFSPGAFCRPRVARQQGKIAGAFFDKFACATSLTCPDTVYRCFLPSIRPFKSVSQFDRQNSTRKKKLLAKSFIKVFFYVLRHQIS